MNTPENSANKENQFGKTTKIWAGICHNCGICAYANRRPDSTFEKLMRWHRTWCPGWAAHTKDYGMKSFPN